MAEQENYEGRSNGLSQAAKGMGISDRFRLFPLVGQGVGQQGLPAVVHEKGRGVCGGTVGSLPHVERPKGADNPAAAGAPNKKAGQKPAFLFGASDATRTRDLLITKVPNPFKWR